VPCTHTLLFAFAQLSMAPKIGYGGVADQDRRLLSYFGSYVCRTWNRQAARTAGAPGHTPLQYFRM
jgi:hypothetical protein